MEAMNESERTMTTNGSLRLAQLSASPIEGLIQLCESTHTFKPASPLSVYSFNMVFEDPPAPAALADDGRGAAGALRLHREVSTCYGCPDNGELIGGLAMSGGHTEQHWLHEVC
jgi:hypothetical protein